MEENKNNEWKKEFDKRFADSSIDFRYKGDRDVMKYEISKIIAQDRENQKKTIRDTVATNLDKYCIYEVSAESLMTDNLSLTKEE